MDRVADWVALVDRHYPERDAAAWDATGLQVGAPDDAVTRVLVCLDVTDAALDEAAREGCDLLLAHHPLLFRPLAALTPRTAAGWLALRAARQGTAVLAAHTNLDVAEAGTTAPIVEALGLADVRPLVPAAAEPGQELKLVTFVPHAATAAVLAAVSAAGAGVIGEYDQCSFRVAGTGTFRPSAAANPASGTRGRLNEEAEDRLEVVVPRSRLGAAVAALWDAHPYEEVAYDVYPLVSVPGRGGAKGLGRVGDLAEPTPLRAVADRLATALPAPFLRVAGDLSRTVRRIAACGGAGDSLVAAAQAAGADVYVTGDLRHHPALDALTLGLALVDAGHHATEAAALPAFRRALAGAAAERGLRATLVASAISTEPWAPYTPPGATGRPNDGSGREGAP
ncbi:MAG TPA: Nif3-like dinuclear metal center hexameric protein [Egibacteraceae bacterium]|nr:Nif3-like dinuclear metal center hexameric protein [Egibacteraceae bacterium]